MSHLYRNSNSIPKTKFKNLEGEQDYFFTKNTRNTFFKNSYLQHTDFSMEMVSLTPFQKDTKLKAKDKPLHLTFTIPRSGDLINNINLNLTLPDIYSFDSTIPGGNTVDKATQFRWVNRIGEYIIKEATFFIGEVEVNKIFSEWLTIWAELNIPKEKKDGYNKLIGNINELNDITSSSYPESGELKDNNGTGTTVAFSPSIKSYQLVIPLPFWLTTHSSLSLPLISLQYEVCRVEIELRPFNELFTIVDNDTSARTKPTSDNHHFSKFLNMRLDGGVKFYSNQVVNELEITPRLQINYIYLEKKERIFFGSLQQDYKITQVKQFKKVLDSNLKLHRIKLPFTGKCKRLIWLLRRTDYTDNNQFYNFTNWPLKKINPITNQGNDFNPFNTSAVDTITSNNFNCLKNENIFENARILLDGKEIFEIKSHHFFNLVNNYCHSLNIPDKGIYVYSFELFSDKHNKQSTGYLNLSKHSKLELELHLIQKDLDLSYNYELMVFNENYNTLKIISGMGNLEFSN